MAKNHSVGAKNCKCSKCSAEAHSVPGTQHRRCTGSPLAEGQEVATLRPKHEKLESIHRGTWA